MIPPGKKDPQEAGVLPISYPLPRNPADVYFFRLIAEEAFLLKLIVTVISKILLFFTEIKPSL